MRTTHIAKENKEKHSLLLLTTERIIHYSLTPVSQKPLFFLPVRLLRTLDNDDIYPHFDATLVWSRRPNRLSHIRLPALRRPPLRTSHPCHLCGLSRNRSLQSLSSGLDHSPPVSEALSPCHSGRKRGARKHSVIAGGAFVATGVLCKDTGRPVKRIPAREANRKREARDTTSRRCSSVPCVKHEGELYFVAWLWRILEHRATAPSACFHSLHHLRPSRTIPSVTRNPPRLRCSRRQIAAPRAHELT